MSQTFADAILSISGNITERERKAGQFLDSLQVERERGITVKAQTASILFTDKRQSSQSTGKALGSNVHLLNLIDTPGHVDFNYEVSRSLASCSGCLLLVDASQGLQAQVSTFNCSFKSIQSQQTNTQRQTLSNYSLAKELGLKVVPVVTKVDLPYSAPVESAIALAGVLDCDPDDVIMTSAKSGKGILQVCVSPEMR